MASTLYIKGGILYFYLHETLGFKNELAIKIRDKQLAALKSSFYNYSIVCITPKEPIQKDFSVCGVFAINMARYVLKNPLGWGSFLVNQKIKNPCFGEVAIEYIPVKSLPPELLKVCQRVEHISPDNKRTLIGHKNKWDLTLGEYLTAYGGKHAALVKLIKYINEYAAIRKDSQPAKSNIAPVMEDRSGKRSKRKRCQIVESSSGDLSEPKPKRERTLKINDRLSGQNLFVKLEST